MSVFDRFKITIIVENNRKKYKKTREYKQGENNGSCHIDNIPTTAKYIGQEILREIQFNKLWRKG